MVEARSQVTEDHTGSFRVLPLGSFWTAHNKGNAQDDWCAKACTSSSSDWCNKFMGAASSRFDVGLYGAEGVLVCARYWASKAELQYTKWMQAGAYFPYTYSAEELQAFTESPAFSGFMRYQGPHLKLFAWKRLQDLRALSPH